MARVDFYLLAAAGEPSRELFACRLAEKVYRLEQSVHIHTADPQQASHLDDLLWTFRDGSFVPHQVVEHGDGPVEAPVTIGCSVQALRTADLLINLSDDRVDASSAFPRLAEIVTSDEERKQRSRRLFAEYRSQGHDLETHDIM
jgi:DNA polymerase III subunit chi